MASKLKLCPFCGGRAKLDGWFVSNVVFVYCSGCGARGPEGDADHATSGWNRRVLAEAEKEPKNGN